MLPAAACILPGALDNLAKVDQCAFGATFQRIEDGMDDLFLVWNVRLDISSERRPDTLTRLHLPYKNVDPVIWRSLALRDAGRDHFCFALEHLAQPVRTLGMGLEPSRVVCFPRVFPQEAPLRLLLDAGLPH